MHIENMKAIEEILASNIKTEFDKGVECVDTEEMGTVIDMLKDIESAIYHATVTAAMGDYGHSRSYTEPYYHRMTAEQYRDIDRASDKRMYYTEPNVTAEDSHMESNYDRTKRMYTETKAIHADGTSESKQARMKDLESYLKELSTDITELVSDMTAEEKQLAKQKLSVLITKM